MPELPEVQTVVNGLQPFVVGRRIVRATLARRDIVVPIETDLCPLLCGKTVTAVGRRGKKIVFTMDDGARFVIHLGMSGQLTVDDPSSPVAKHTHLIVDFEPAGGAPMLQLRFKDPRRFGGVWWLGTSNSADGTLGPEPLSMHWRLLARRLRKTRRSIKTTLLDQTIVAGIGNIYADESLFEARIHPLAQSMELTDEQVRRLTRAIKLILRRAIRLGGSTLRDYRAADGSSGAFQNRHRAYDRTGKPCKRCKTPIERIIVGGRSTHFCPNCQVAPRRLRV